jgi:hypothetical protein
MKNILADTSLNLIDCLQEILNTGYIPKDDHNHQWVENEIRFAKEQLAYARLCEGDRERERAEEYASYMIEAEQP